MIDHNKKAVIVFNDLVYNFMQLTDQLLKKDIYLILGELVRLVQKFKILNLVTREPLGASSMYAAVTKIVIKAMNSTA